MPKKEKKEAPKELSALETEKYVKKKLPNWSKGGKTVVYANAFQDLETPAARSKEGNVRIRVVPVSAYEACMALEQARAGDMAMDASLKVSESNLATSPMARSGFATPSELSDLPPPKELCELPLVLDFASDSNPGGGWRSQQQGTQEEALCRGSTLGLRLEEQFQRGEYLPSAHSAIYLDKVQVFHVASKDSVPALTGFLEKAVQVAVVAASLRDCDGDVDFMQRKIAGVLKIALEHGHQNLVLGAWGCGAFGNDPELVAQAFKRELSKHACHFGEIVFAIPGEKKANFQVFQNILGR